ncbi:dual specificity protein phosphatase 1-like [Mizuhopecten yessoensis]|uniref:dual specificity protein phosphatase 1-like n=1 Tax=Mizuhopecten yessoensis TaxID=6573 RepID=UPI000B45CFBF|nr:dual specificity protein phosphatase 1-like [Mizuhopecten yessoensis]
MEVNLASGVSCTKVVEWLEDRASCRECVLMLDCRPFMAFNDGHIRNSLNVHCPPILKRRSGGFVALENIVPCSEKREMLKEGHFNTIVLYDSDTTDLTLSSKDSNLYSVLKSLRQQVENCQAVYIQGGFDEFSTSYPHLCDIQGSICRQTLCVNPSVPSSKMAFVQGEPVEILPYLFLGNSQHASQFELLERLGITSLINVSTSCRNHFEEKFTYMNIPLDDNDTADLAAWFTRSITFIDTVKEQSGRVLVHCHAGVSRSATICLAYLMFTAKIGLEVAFEHVQSRRSVISPNLNFMRQLKAYESELGVMCLSSDSSVTPSSSGATSTSSASSIGSSDSVCPEDVVSSGSHPGFNFAQCPDREFSRQPKCMVTPSSFDFSFPCPPSAPLLSPS